MIAIDISCFFFFLRFLKKKNPFRAETKVKTKSKQSGGPLDILNGCVAQLVEQCLCKAWAAGSKPVASTPFLKLQKKKVNFISNKVLSTDPVLIPPLRGTTLL